MVGLLLGFFIWLVGGLAFGFFIGSKNLDLKLYVFLFLTCVFTKTVVLVVMGKPLDLLDYLVSSSGYMIGIYIGSAFSNKK